MKFAFSLFLAWQFLAGGFSASPAAAQNAPAASPPASAPRASAAANPAPASSDPAAPAAAAGGDYVLAPADTIEMSVFNQPSLTTRSPIASDGSVQFPLVGELKIGGLALRDAREVIRNRYNADYLVEPQVYLNVVSYAAHTYTILGQVNRPGTYDFPGGKHLSLLEAVGIAGGFTRVADQGNVTIKRTVGGVATTTRVSAKARANRDKAAYELQPGDVVTVAEGWF